MFHPPLLDALRRLAGPGISDASDADLLARYVHSRDGAAFEAIVRRHGGTVWGACRRRLRDLHAAEDAFQTTFLALARNAASVRRPDALGAWLHRVAVRCSTAFRPSRDSMSALPPDVPARAPDPAAVVAGQDLERVIDTEIDALPEPYRLAFVLCEVEQQSTADAAQALGCPVGTVESRLTRARQHLRGRLSRRGIRAGALVGLGLAAGPVPASARAGAIALATGAAPIPAVWAAVADRAVRAVSGLTLGAGVLGGVALVGLGGLIAVLVQTSGTRPGPVPAAPARVAPDVAIPEQDQFRRNRHNFPLPPEAIARVGDPWLRHGVVPTRMAFSGDGRFLAAHGPGDPWLRVWDLTTGRPRAHLPLGQESHLAALALSEDGGTLRALVHAGETRAAQLREYDTFRAIETRRRRLTEGVTDTAAFNADGRQLALVNGRRIRMIQTSTAEVLWQTEVPTTDGGRVELAFSSFGGRLAVLPAGTDRVRLLDQSTGRPAGELVDSGAALSMPTFSADGKRLAVWCSTGQWVRVWDVSDRRVNRTVVPNSPLSGLVFSPTGEQVAGFAGSRAPTIWSVVNDGTKSPMLRDAMGGLCGRFSPDGTMLAVGTHTGAIQVFDARTGRLHPTSQNMVLTPTPVAFGRDGRLIMDGWQRWFEYSTDSIGDDPPRVLDPGAGPNEPFVFGAADRAALSPDRKLIARCTRLSKTERVYALDLLDAETQAPRGQIPLTGFARRPTFSPNGKIVYAICGDRLIRGWNIETGLEVMKGDRRAGDLVSRLLVSADGKYLATAVLVLTDGQQPNSIHVWDAATGESILSADAGHARPYVAFSPDGRRFAAAVLSADPDGPRHELRVWDIPTRKIVAIVPGCDGQPAFSPDGRAIAVTKVDAVILIEVATGRPRHAFQHHGKVEPALAWREDGRVLAAASPEAPVYLWDIVGDRTGNPPAWVVAHDDRRWEALSGEDAPEAFQAIRQLWTFPANAAPFLKARMPATADSRLSARVCEVLELVATPEARELLVAWSAGPLDAPRTKEAKDSLRRLAVAVN